MTRTISLITAVAGLALALAAPAAFGKGQPVPQDVSRVAPIGSPDAFDRALAARQREMLDAREQALQAKHDDTAISALDARERAFGEKRIVQLRGGGSTDVVQRTVGAHGRRAIEPVRDDRFRLDPTTVPAPVSVSSSGRDLEWPQLGIGFGIGLLLVVGLYLAVRFTRIRPLVH